MAEIRSSLPTTFKKSEGETSPRARPRTIRVLIWLPQLPAVSISMGMKETSRGRLTKAASYRVVTMPVKVADSIRISSQGIRCLAWVQTLVPK